MGRRTWIKIFSDKWLRGSIRQEGLEVRAIWIDLLALAADSAYGDEGLISIAPKCGLSDQQISAIFNIDIKLWKNAKQRLIRTDRIAVNGENEINIVNWKKYQSEYQRTKKAQRKYYQKKRVIEKGDRNHTPISIKEKREERKEKEKEKENNTTKKQNITFNFSTLQWENITEKDKKGWEEAYPACDIALELKQMKEWIISNPEQKKKKYRRFITNWLTRSQEKGGTRKYKGDSRKSFARRELERIKREQKGEEDHA